MREKLFRFLCGLAAATLSSESMALFVSTSAQAAGVVYGVANGQIRSYDVSTGSILANFGNVSTTSDLVYGDGVIYGLFDGQIRSYDAATKDPLNTLGFDAAGRACPCA